MRSFRERTASLASRKKSVSNIVGLALRGSGICTSAATLRLAAAKAK